jgi:hypothetical protein
MTQHLSARYKIDPADPRAPSLEEWERMTAAERAEVVAMLPGEEKLDALAAETGRAAQIAKLGSMLEEGIAHQHDAEARAAELEEKLASSEEKLARALAEIEQLKRGR